MSELGEARALLLEHYRSTGASIHDAWNEEKNDWFSFANSVLESGCVWDSSKDFPMDDLLRRVVRSKVVDTLLSKA